MSRGTERGRGLPALVLAALLSGCAASPPSRGLYEALGGEPGITAIVEGLLFRMVENPQIAHHFADADIINLRQRLIEQLCFESGGPCAYAGLSMQESHAGRQISEADFNALVEDLQAVMDAQGVSTVAQNRLLRRLAPMHSDIVER